jgi:uncharacterized Fe-S center protein
MVDVFLSKTISKLLEKANLTKLGNNVAIKVHFGERGCETYMRPEIVQAVYKKVKALGKEATLVETNVLYRGSRTNATDHKLTAKEHGFTFAPIDIVDGEKGDEFSEIKIQGGTIDSAKIGKGLEKYDSMVVITHFKGHIAAGYGGSFKQIGMGLGSRAGKLHMHAGVSPSIQQAACIGCAKCQQGCDFDAIDMIDNKAKIDPEKCSGCAMCIAVCPVGCVSVPWGASTNEELQKKIVDYTSAVFEIIPRQKCIFINIMEKITKDCDCFSTKQTPLMDDVGILLSEDPVAIDNACLELAEKHSPGVLKKINSIDKNVQVDYAQSRGLGSKEYNLVELD